MGGRIQKASYSQWAIGEIINYIAKRLYPQTSGTVDEFYIFTQDFMKKMSRYSQVNPQTSKIFRIARDMSADILDLLQAMNKKLGRRKKWVKIKQLKKV